MEGVARMVRVTAIIPFFGGTSSATHSLEDTRLAYLRSTIDSLDVQGIEPILYLSTKDTSESAARISDDIAAVWLNVEPIWLAHGACVHMQKQLDGIDLIYVTEADQILHVHDEGVYDLPNDTQYLAPWRLDLVGPQGECELPNGTKLEVDGRVYSITNGGHHIPRSPGIGTVHIHAQQQAFSGAFLCTREFFRRINFRRRHLLPVEHATGFDANSAGDCLKTEWVERFYIDHLSPRDRYLKEVN